MNPPESLLTADRTPPGDRSTAPDRPTPVPGNGHAATNSHDHPTSDVLVDPWSVLEEFASVIGHELRTPLAVIKQAAETGITHHEALGDQGVLRLLEMISRNSDLALLLVDRIGLARDIENDTVALARERIELTTLVAESVDDLRQVVLQEHPVQVGDAGPLEISGDPTALREIVFNLLANAAKYSPDDATIDVTVQRRRGKAEVVVRDHGAGVSPGDTETIFTKFYQGNPASPGAGLGLYISRGLARAHDGDLHVQPADEHGSEFVLTLPA